MRPLGLSTSYGSLLSVGKTSGPLSNCLAPFVPSLNSFSHYFDFVTLRVLF